MTEEEKKQEILNFLNEKAFKPMIEYGKEFNDKHIIRVVTKTQNKKKRKRTAREMINRYHDIITHKSLSSTEFLEHLNQKKISTRLEDIEEEFNSRFNEEWLNK